MDRGASAGLNAHTRTVAPAVWVNRSGGPQAIVFIDIDGTSCVSPSPSRGALQRALYREDGGEG